MRERLASVGAARGREVAMSHFRAGIRRAALMAPLLLAACGGGDTLLGTTDGDGTTGDGAPPPREFLDGACRGDECPLEEADTTFHGVSEEFAVGRSVAILGDIDGDGYDDIGIGGIGTREDQMAGIVYVIYGRSDLGRDPSLGGADAKLRAGCYDCAFGSGIAGVGDTNGDGLDDFVVGAPGSGQGIVYLIPGSRTRLRGEMNIEDAPLPGACRFVDGPIVGSAGSQVTAAGDVDGDGLADFLVAARGRTDPGVPGRGAAYLVYGERSRPATAVLGSAAATFVPGEADRMLGSGFQDVAGGIDSDGDGYDDLLLHVGGEGATDPDDRAVLVYGRPERFAGQVTLAATADIAALEDDSPEFAESLASGGDIDGDGYGDWLVVASGNRIDPGRLWVVWGGPTRLESTTDVAAVGSAFVPDRAGDELGLHVASAGDPNLDGFADALVVTRSDSGDGAVRLVWGAAERPTADLPLSGAGPSFFGAVYGSDWDYIDGALAGGGDVNGDGRDDFLAAAPSRGSGPGRYGRVYVVLGADR